MLVIKPDGCIDYPASELKFPIDVIKPDTEQDLEKLLQINIKYPVTWKNIVLKKSCPADNDNFRNKESKYKNIFQKIKNKK